MTFRLTKAEYERLRATCEESASSVSDAARSAVLALASAIETSGTADLTLDKFDKKLDQIITMLLGMRGLAGC